MLFDNDQPVPFWHNIVDPYRSGHQTPVGYDFTVESLKSYGFDVPAIYQESKQLPTYHEMQPLQDGPIETWFLRPGIYLATFLELVSIPEGYLGIMHPRSTLLRCGATLETAIWDSGYQGVSSTALVVHNPNGIILERNTRIGHMTLHPVTTPNGLYQGQYQGEGT